MKGRLIRNIKKKDSGSNIIVAVRIRPPNRYEQNLLNLGEGQIFIEHKVENFVIIMSNHLMYTFDKAFGRNSNQVDIYNQFAYPIFKSFMQGNNSSIIAYGQTGSGKTYTILGSDIYDPEFMGIIPRSIINIFHAIMSQKTFIIKCSLLEIYQETLIDLTDVNFKKKVKISENFHKGVQLEGLNEFPVNSVEEAFTIIQRGENNRKVAKTKINSKSSRSHIIFRITLYLMLQSYQSKYSVLHLVDLAGSEKSNKSDSNGILFEEAKKINLSLSSLGNVIHALTNKFDYIPYRNSKLTRVMQESFGGNCKTAIIITCSPHSHNAEETISSMKFALRAKQVKNYRYTNRMSKNNHCKSISLKSELEVARNEILRLKNTIINMNIKNDPLSPLRSENLSFINTCDQFDLNGINNGLIIESTKSNKNLLEV